MAFWTDVLDDVRRQIRAEGLVRKHPALLPLLVFSAFVLGSAGLGVFMLLGHVLALGVWAGLRSAAPYWLHIVSAGALFGAVVGLAAGGMYFVPSAYTVAANRLLSQRWRVAVGKVSFALLIGALLALLPVAGVVSGYQKARQDHDALFRPQTAFAGATNGVARQVESLKRLSTASSALLQELDATSQDVARAKVQLSGVLSAYEAQRSAVERAQQTVTELQAGRVEVEKRLSDLRTILEGQAPITRADLERANTNGLMLGALFGFFTSLAATVLYDRLVRRRRTPSVPTAAGPV